LYRFIFYSALLFSTVNSFAQDAPWSLQKCVDYATQNNLTVQQSMINEQIAQATFLSSKLNFLPTVNGQASETFSYGKTINPLTNQYINENINYSDFGLGANLTLFSGLQKWNSTKANQYAWMASQLDTKTEMNAISLLIVQDYLGVLFAQEQFKLSQNQKSLDDDQVSRTQKLVDAGSLAEGSLLTIQAQQSNDQLNVVNAQNSLTQDLLDIQQVLNLDKPINIEVPDVAITNDMLIENLPSFDTVYQLAVQNQPQIKSAQYKIMSAQKSVSAAKGSLYPTVTGFFNLATDYASNFQNISSVKPTGVDTIGFVAPTLEPVVTPVFNYEYSNIPFGTQLNNNLGKTLGVQLNVPIFNGWAAHTAVDKAKLNLKLVELAKESTDQQLRKDVETAYTSAVAARNSYNAALESVQSLQKEFDYMKQKFDLGAANSLDYTTAQNNLAQAESNVLQQKYNLLFRLKNLDFYEGKPLKL
jgi:outer membrane protein